MLKKNCLKSARGKLVEFIYWNRNCSYKFFWSNLFFSLNIEQNNVKLDHIKYSSPISGHSLLHEEHWFRSRNWRNRGFFPDVLAGDGESQDHRGLGAVRHQRPGHQLQVTTLGNSRDLFSHFRIHFNSIRIPLRKQFEIIVTLEGITPETGNTVQVSVRSNIRNDFRNCQF